MTDLHIIYSESGEDYGWSIETPQIPELVGGRNTIAELIADTPSIIEFASDPGQEFDRTVLHEQHLVIDPDGDEYLIRWAHDSHEDERRNTAARLNHSVLNGLHPEDKPKQPTLATGERLLIAVQRDDTVGWIQDQLGSHMACVLSQRDSGSDAIYSIPFGDNGLGGAKRWTLEDLGLTRDSTFSEMFDAVMSSEAKDLAVRVDDIESTPVSNVMTTV